MEFWLSTAKEDKEAKRSSTSPAPTGAPKGEADGKKAKKKPSKKSKDEVAAVVEEVAKEEVEEEEEEGKKKRSKGDKVRNYSWYSGSERLTLWIMCTSLEEEREERRQEVAW